MKARLIKDDDGKLVEILIDTENANNPASYSISASASKCLLIQKITGFNSEISVFPMDRNEIKIK